MSSKKESEIVIRSLTDRDAVRTRPGMYIGSVSNPDVIFREVIDGSFDESYATGCDQIIISTNLNGYYFVADNGRGIPITMSIDDPTQTQCKLAIGKLHAGSSFENTDGEVRAGMHGCGEAAANFLSSEFIVLSRITPDNYDKSIPEVKQLWDSSGPTIRKNLYYTLVYKEGLLVYEGAYKRSDLEKTLFSGKTKKAYTELPTDMSTMVLFKPDPKIFDSVKAELPIQNIQNFLLIQEKYYKRKVNVWADGTILKSSGFKPYNFEFIKTIVPADPSLNSQISVYVTFEVDPNLGSKSESGSVNGLTVNQGVHISWIEQFYEEALRNEYKISHKCIFQGFKVHVLLLAGEVLYDSQTKVRLRSISKVKQSDLEEPIVKEFQKIFRKNSDYWEAHVEKLNLLAESMKSISATEKAQKMMESAAGNSVYRMKSKFIDSFTDATAGQNDRWNCEIFICEGKSPYGSLKAGRKDCKHIAVMGLRGKVLNTVDKTADQMLDNAEMNSIFMAIGLGLDCNNVTNGCSTPEEAYERIRKTSRYGKIIISTDADSDGSQIANGLLYSFSKYARFLIDFGLVYIALSPIYEQHGKYYYPNDPRVAGTDFPIGLDPSKPYHRYKGLGSLNKEDIFDVFYNSNTRRLLQITPEGLDYSMGLMENIENRRKLLFDAGILSNPYKFNDI